MEGIKKIDIHAHAALFPELTPLRTWDQGRMLSGKELACKYDQLNIEKGVLLPIVSPEGAFSTISVESAKVISDQQPDRFVWFCNIDPRSCENSETADFRPVLEHYKALGAKGVGEITSNVYADDPKLDNMFRHCEEAGLPVIIHISPKLGFNYGIVDDLGLPRLEKMLKKHPDLKIIGHSQPFWAEISGTLTEETRNQYPTGKVVEGALTRLMREYGNLHCDLSAGSGSNAMMRDPEHAARFLEEFSDRIFYGCDICASFNTFMFKFDAFLDKMVEDKMLSMENYVKIVRGNATRLLQL